MSKVLLIEPNTLLAATYRQALQHAGHSVVHVTSGQAAADAADTLRPDVLILELQLPAHNGIEFLHEFRSYGDWATIPVIINTVIPPSILSDIEDILERDLQVCAVRYKPRTTLQDLLGLVREHAFAS